MDDDLWPATITCRACGQTKPITEYDRRNDSTQRHRMCKPCRRTYQRERWQCANPPKPKRSKRVVGSFELFTCTRCKRGLADHAFPRRVKGSPILQSWCRECFSAYNRANYIANREREVTRIHANQRRQRAVNRQMLAAYLAVHPCVDCGEADHDVLEFDHLRDKRFDISLMVHSGRSWRSIETEIAKCDVRCANCHRRKTKQRRIEAQAIATPGRLERPTDAGSKPAALSTELRGRSMDDPLLRPRRDSNTRLSAP